MDQLPADLPTLGFDRPRFPDARPTPRHARPEPPDQQDDEARQLLLEAVRSLHAEVTRLSLPLDVPGAAQMRHERAAVLGLLDGYLVERLRATERPLLVVIGGPTGAGKSTLLNSLVGATVSPSGVLRPTTRMPVLLHHPDDAEVLHAQNLLPGLEAVTGPAPLEPRQGIVRETEPLRKIRLVPQREISRGLAILDSPDLDSWLTANRELAAELLAVADMWLFVTTGTDYADAVPWQLLNDATKRRVSVATVLNRMRPVEIDSVRTHFARMLIERGLSDAPVFTVPEVALVADRIPYQYVSQLHSWLGEQAQVESLREEYIGRAVEGSLDQMIVSVRRLVDAAADQVVAERRLRVDLKAIVALAREEIHEAAVDGRVADVVQDAWHGVLSAPGQLPAASGGGLFRRLNAALRPTTLSPYVVVGSSLRAALADLVGQQVGAALGELAQRWGSHPAAASAGVGVDVAALPEGFREGADAVLGQWLDVVHQRLGGAHERSAGGSRWSPAALAAATLAVGARTSEPEAPGAVALRVLAEYRIADVESVVALARNELRAALDSIVDAQEARLAARLDEAEVSRQSGSALRGELESLEQLQRTLYPPGGRPSAGPDVAGEPAPPSPGPQVREAFGA